MLVTNQLFSYFCSIWKGHRLVLAKFSTSLTWI